MAIGVAVAIALSVLFPALIILLRSAADHFPKKHRTTVERLGQSRGLRLVSLNRKSEWLLVNAPFDIWHAKFIDAAGEPTEADVVLVPFGHPRVTFRQ
jgi:hypothetical protein